MLRPCSRTAPPQTRLSREIALALAIKLVLLTGLWALFFRGSADKSVAASGVQGWFESAAPASGSTPIQP